jgi:hypothetical protein
MAPAVTAVTDAAGQNEQHAGQDGRHAGVAASEAFRGAPGITCRERGVAGGAAAIQ